MKHYWGLLKLIPPFIRGLIAPSTVWQLNCEQLCGLLMPLTPSKALPQGYAIQPHTPSHGIYHSVKKNLSLGTKNLSLSTKNLSLSTKIFICNSSDYIIMIPQLGQPLHTTKTWLAYPTESEISIKTVSLV